MTDTTKPIDLSTLEQGDTVVFRDGQKALVTHVCDNGYDGLKLYMFVACDSNKQPLQFEDDYQQDGQVQFHNSIENDIVQIIKNPKRWTDEDMKAAFIDGFEAKEKFTKYTAGDLVIRWLQQYKERKHEQ